MRNHFQASIFNTNGTKFISETYIKFSEETDVHHELEMRALLKFLLIAVSVIITVLGVGLTLVGIIIKFRTEMIDGYLTPIIKDMPAGGGTGADVWTIYNMNAIALITFGIAVCILGFIGCLVGACPKKQVIIVYMVFTAVLMMLQLTSAALILTTKIADGLKDTLRINLVRSYRGEDADDEYSDAWNYAFVQFSCCGVESYTDFKLTILWDREKTDDNNTTYTVTVPVTCCKLPGKYPDYGNPYNKSCPTDPSTENSYYIQNCYKKIDEYLQYYGILMSCSCIGVIVFEGLFMAILMVAVTEMKRQRNKIKQALIDENEE